MTPRTAQTVDKSGRKYFSFSRLFLARSLCRCRAAQQLPKMNTFSCLVRVSHISKIYGHQMHVETTVCSDCITMEPRQSVVIKVFDHQCSKTMISCYISIPAVHVCSIKTAHVYSISNLYGLDVKVASHINITAVLGRTLSWPLLMPNYFFPFLFFLISCPYTW